MCNQGFIVLVRQRLPEELDDWLEQAVIMGELPDFMRR
jgi:hypothetical protein